MEHDVRFLAMFLIALFRVKTVNLAEARNRICGKSAN